MGLFERGFLSSLKQGGVDSEYWTWFDESLKQETKNRVCKVHSAVLNELLVDAINNSNREMKNIDVAINELLDNQNYMVKLLHNRKIIG